MKRVSTSTTTGWFLAVPLLLLLFPTRSLLAVAATGQHPVLVELFTSEGCSSCPPADQLLLELDSKQPVDDAHIIVLSEHVDYWNSLGWQDPYSSAQWSDRQSDYARRFSLRSVYTPQLVIGGAEQVVGSDRGAVLSAIKRSAATTPVPLTISSAWRVGDSLRVTFVAGPLASGELFAAIADDSDRSSVERGENAGRVLGHVAVLRSLARIATLQGAPLAQTVEIAIPPSATTPHLRVVLFAQDRKTGRIVGAAAREL